MAETLRISRKELTSVEVLDELEEGRRVVIEVEVLGRTMEMTIRRGEEEYYCDTPFKLLTYDDRSAMRTCLERYGLARPEGHDDAPSGK